MLFAVYGMGDVPSGVRTPLTVGIGLFCTGLAVGASALHHYRRGVFASRTALCVGAASTAAVGLVSGFVVTQLWPVGSTPGGYGGASRSSPSSWPDGWCGAPSDD